MKQAKQDEPRATHDYTLYNIRLRTKRPGKHDACPGVSLATKRPRHNKK
ncbi:hypothetical protein [Prevotella sp. S7-1-8]|nr:hypothetical protein [Prevotella sp. S7-1-8]